MVSAASLNQIRGAHITNPVVVCMLIVPVYLVPSAFPICLYLSFAVTIMASSLIIYRIFAVCGHNRGSFSSYYRVIEVVAESGALHAVPLPIAATLWLLCDANDGCSDSNSSALNYWMNVVVPMAVR